MTESSSGKTLKMWAWYFQARVEKMFKGCATVAAWQPVLIKWLIATNLTQ